MSKALGSFECEPNEKGGLNITIKIVTEDGEVSVSSLRGALDKIVDHIATQLSDEGGYDA